MNKKLYEMNNKELFGVLTGSQGPMAQLYLRQMIISYRKTHAGENASLEEIVRAYEELAQTA